MADDVELGNQANRQAHSALNKAPVGTESPAEPAPTV
jgi:hypothetical protein